jgi:hypothetical protein
LEGAADHAARREHRDGPTAAAADDAVDGCVHAIAEHRPRLHQRIGDLTTSPAVGDVLHHPLEVAVLLGGAAGGA